VTRPLLSACVALALLAAAPAAVADEVSEARALFDQGAKLYHSGKYREAIVKFEAAYRIKPHGALHFNVAQCREKLGEWPAALRSYQDYLRELPDARDRAAVRASIVRIEQRLSAAGVQALLVYSDPPRATVAIDGRARGRTPFHITLPPGSYRVALTLEGFASEEVEVDLDGSASRIVELVLSSASTRSSPRGAATGAPATRASPAAPPTQPVTPAAQAAVPPPPAGGSAQSSSVPMAGPPSARPSISPAPPLPPPPLALAEKPRPAQPEPPRRLYTWVALGVGVAAGAAGVWQGLEARKASDALRDGTVHADADTMARNARRQATTANVLYGLSGVAVAAGATLFFVEVKF
jgi:hypothetical protein